MQHHNVTAARPTQRTRKIGLRILIGALLIGLPFVRSSYPYGEFHETLEAIGQVLIVIGILGRTWCTMHIGGHKFTELVTAGPFSISRNPLYVFSLVATFGAGLQTGSALFALIATIGAWFIIDVTVRKEETALAARFGDTYEAYQTTTPRYWPRLSAWRAQDAVIVSMPLVYGTMRDGLLFFLIVPVAELVDWLQHTGRLPVLLELPF